MGTNFFNAYLISYVHHDTNIPTKTPDLEEPYEIPTNAIKYVMSNTFPGDVTMDPKDHLQLIEERCSLFKLSGITQDRVKSKLFIMSLSANAKKC